MNSNMQAGERRWASARRGGMTVLGKVAVPKPLNLPSQRLENHGLDPNVEIVPKGTLSWGSRPSSSGSNAWVSLPSANADGGPGSPGHPSGRPSSGGSGTRPSTAGSDKAHETDTNASTSRPTSSSGTLSSNHTPSTLLHPRSAENRPTSSHLSRFAEPVSRNSLAWGPSMAAEKMGLKSSKEDGFSLSSGDFPNLGSEKDTLEKNKESEGNRRPRSAFGRISQTNDDIGSQADVKSESVNIWNADDSSDVENVNHPVTGKNHGEPLQYFNVNAPHQPFDSWRGPPMNGPAGVWYGSHPRGPAVGVPNTPRGFPVEAFPYYHPQMPPPPGAGPNMPFRPGFYPGAPGPMVFGGYYRPPMGYCNNERDVPPFMGIAAGHPVYNGFGGPGANTGNAHGRPVAHKVSSDHMETGYSVHHQAPKRAPEGNPNEYNQSDRENQSCDVKGKNSGRKLPILFRKNEWGAEEETEELDFAKRQTPNENISLNHKYAVHSEDSEIRKLHGGVPHVKTVADDKLVSESERVRFLSPGIPLVSEKNESSVAGARNSALIHRIDGHSDPSSAHCEEDEWNGPHLAEQSNISKDVSPVAHEVNAPRGHKHVPTAVLSRKPYKARQIGVDDHPQRRPFSSESWAAVSSRKTNTVSSVNVDILNVSAEDGWNSSAMNQPGIEGDLVEPHIATDTQAQRSKMRELAKQRAMQLQKEEDERMKEQKAKALAKLKELNRRTLSTDTLCQKDEAIMDTCDNEASEKVHEFIEPAIVDTKFLEFGKIKMRNQDGTPSDESVELPLNVETLTLSDTGVSPLEKVIDCHVGSPIQKVSESGDDQGTKQTKNNSFLKSMTEKSGDDKNAATDDVLSHENVRTDANMPVTNIAKISKVVTVPSAHQRKRSNKNSKYKQRSNETSINSAMDSREVSIENTELKNSLSDVESHVLHADKPDKEVSTQECSSLLTEEFDRRASVQSKPHSRRFSRIQQGNRFVDKLHSNDNVMWAPVKTQSIVEVESNQKSEEVSANSTSKGKRAEIERYVPKPVAKELAQQISIQPLSSIETTQKEQSKPDGSLSLAGSGLDINEGDFKPAKFKKNSGTWRQRGSVDSSETKPFSGVVRSDENDPVSIDVPYVKAQGPVNREKRQFTKGSRSTVNHFDSEITAGNEVDQSYVQQTEKGIFSRENRSYVEKVSSHWQPKTHSNPTNESITEANKHSKKGHQMQDQHVNFRRDLADSNPGQLQELEQEKPTKPRVHSPTENLEPVPSSSKNGHQRERNLYSGHKLNNPSYRMHDSRGEWQASGQEKQRQNEMKEEQDVVYSRRVGNNSRRVGNYYRGQRSSVPATD